MAPLLAPGAEDAPFLRLWHGFLTGRVMVALTLLLFMATGLVLNQNTESWMVALCLAYLVSSIAVRVIGRRWTRLAPAGNSRTRRVSASTNASGPSNGHDGATAS